MKPGSIVKPTNEFSKGAALYQHHYGEIVTFETHPHIKTNSGHTLEHDSHGKIWVYWPELPYGATLWREQDLVLVCE